MILCGYEVEVRDRQVAMELESRLVLFVTERPKRETLSVLAGCFRRVCGWTRQAARPAPAREASAASSSVAEF